MATLRSGWLTAGPQTTAFEVAFSDLKAGLPCVAVNSCTAGLFLALRALDLQPGDEVITTPMTFVATANVVQHAGGEVVFADTAGNSMNISAEAVAERITPKTRAILPVHVGGNPCDMAALMEVAEAHRVEIIEDCAHAIEGEFAGRPLGSFGMAGAFSFYPTKNITTGEGGMVSCRDAEIAHRVRLLSRHGVDKGTYQRMEQEGEPLYDVVLPGYKCNMTDLQAAMGLAQLKRLGEMYLRRKEIFAKYEAAFQGLDMVDCIDRDVRGKSALHLYQLLLKPEVLVISRGKFIAEARELGVELSVNYTPIHLFSWYRSRFCAVPGAFPNAEYCGMNNISLPFYPAMSDLDVEYVILVISGLLNKYHR